MLTTRKVMTTAKDLEARFSVHELSGKKLLKVQFQGQSKNIIILDRHTKPFDVHPLVENLNTRHETGLKLLDSNAANFMFLLNLDPFVVNASIAYERPGTRLGKEIVSTAQGEPRVVLATGKYEGEKDVALVSLGLRSADFKKDGTSVVLDIPESRLTPVQDFAPKEGWYLPHTETGIPHGKEVGYSSDAVCIFKLIHTAYVGLLATGVTGGRYLFAWYKPSYKSAVVAEVPDADVPKLTGLIDRVNEVKTLF